MCIRDTFLIYKKEDIKYIIIKNNDTIQYHRKNIEHKNM